MNTKKIENCSGRNPAWGTASTVATTAGTTVRMIKNHAKRLRPVMDSSSRPKYQKMASPMMVHRSGRFASGQVTSRHTSPEVTRVGNRARPRTKAGLIDQINIDTAPAKVANTVVVTCN